MRIPWIDTAKGGCIIAVVLIHVGRGLQLAGLISNWAPIDSVLLGFAVPMLFLLAGITSRLGGRPSARILPMAWAYFLWSVVTVLLSVALADHINHIARVSDLLTILWQPVGVYWFLWCLTVFLALQSVVPLRWMAGMAIALLLMSFFLPPGSLGWQFSYYLAFFAAGMVMAPRVMPAKSRSFGVLTYIGILSLPIYLTHPFATSAARMLLQQGFGVTNPVAHFVAGVLAGVALPVLFYRLCAELRLLAALGLGRNRGHLVERAVLA